MELLVKTGQPHKQRTACVIVGVHTKRALTSGAQEINEASGGYLAKILKRGDLDGELEQHLLLHNVPETLSERVLLVGCGSKEKLDDEAFRKINATAASALAKIGANDAVSFLAELEVEDLELHAKARAVFDAFETAAYSFVQFKSKKDKLPKALKKITLAVATRGHIRVGEAAAREAAAVTLGTRLAKDLGNLPANVCTPSYLAKQANELKKDYPELKVEILSEAEMKKLGMGALLSVAQGTREPAKLIVLTYSGAPKSDKPVVLVGKGVTFDTGGISIKPAADMDEMKFDMCGAASVLGVVKACAELRLAVNLVGIVPATENMPDGQATRPGDIVRTLSGKTVEILNTDAEGRLILCDALTYCERFNPDVVIDIATLTGACVVALGQHASGLMANHEPLAEDLIRAGRLSGDRCWQLPLLPAYQEQLKSNFADLANIGGRAAGAITAACFLSRFTEKYRWAHLDIAGSAWLSGNQKGSTGRPVPLIVQYLLGRAANKGAPGTP
jgi:leucyl aminopeptidase